MKVGFLAAPLAAVAAALGTLVCCLPLSFLGAASLIALSRQEAGLRPWLLGGSLALLGLSGWQLYGRRACARRSRVGVVVFWLAATAVLALVLFPQLVAGWLAA